MLNDERDSSLKGRTSYWHLLIPLFRRYGINLRDKPYEYQVKKVVEGWLRNQGVELMPRTGHGIDLVDFEFSWQGLRVGIETKGHSNAPHNLVKILDQIKRYLSYLDYLIIIVHSPALKGQIKRVSTLLPREINSRLLLFKIQEINDIAPQLDEKIQGN